MSEQTTTLYASSSSHHVKVCCLDKSNRWADKGTGYCVYLEGNGDDPDEMVVRSETDSNLLVSSCVFAEKTYHNYQKLGETKISWTDLETNSLAINFEDAKSCGDIWLRMCNKRGVDGQTCTLNESLDDDSDCADTIVQDELALPIPNNRNLDEIAKILENATSIEKSDLATFIVDNCYVNKLFLIFEECERTNKINRPHELFIIMKFIILLSSTKVLEHITSDENIIPVASILEYNTATRGMKENHREVLKAHSLMEPVVPFSDPIIMLTIRRTYRFQYLMDVIMARYLDTNLSSRLQELIVGNHIDTLNYVKCDTNFLKNVFRIIKSHDSDEIKRTQAVQAVIQLCTISKYLQGISRLSLYRKLATYGLLIPIEIAVSSEDSDMRRAAVEILSSIVMLDVSLVRSHILTQQAQIGSGTGNNERNLLQCIINRLTSTIDPGLIYPCDDILKMILNLVDTRRARYKFDPKVKRNQDNQLNSLLSVFYDTYAPSILHPLMSIENKPVKLDGPITVLEHGQDQGEVYSHLLDILCSAVEQHGHQSKDWVVSGDCFVKVAQLYRSQFGKVKLAALHFFRVCVGLMDDDYNKQLIKHNVFESTMRLLLGTKGNWSVLNTNCLELLEFICHENPKLLVSHLVERFGSELDTVDYIPTCSKLRKQYNENRKRLNMFVVWRRISKRLVRVVTSDIEKDIIAIDNDNHIKSSMLKRKLPPILAAKPSDDKQEAFAIDSENNPTETPVLTTPLRTLKRKAADEEDNEGGRVIRDPASPMPLPSLKGKYDHKDRDENNVLVIKVSKHLGQDTPCLTKQNHTLSKATPSP